MSRILMAWVVTPQALALGEELGQVVFADGVAQCCLSREDDSGAKGLHLEHGLLGVPHQPEGDRVDVDRYRVGRQGGFG